MIERHDLGATTILFDPLTGRGRQGALPVSWAVPDVLAGVWCRNRCTLTVREGLWAPDPTRSGPDGHPYRAVPLTDDERAVWAAVNDARTGADLAARSGVLPAVVERLASRLTAFDVQALQIRPQAARAGDPGLRRVLGVPRPPNLRTADWPTRYRYATGWRTSAIRSQCSQAQLNASCAASRPSTGP